MTMVTFVDETAAGARADGWSMDVAEERLTLRELIRRRVWHEVTAFNAIHSDVFTGLVGPRGAEQTSNGHRLTTDRPIDAEEQFARAIKAFGHNGFVVLIGDRQVLDLDEEIDLPAGTEVTFLKLVPLVGG
jgi:hypothetical protein